MMAQVTDSSVTVTPGIAPREYTGWTQGALVFNRVALRDLVVELTRAYGVPVRVEDTVLAREPMTMEVSVRTQSLTRVLELIGLATNAHYTQDGEAYVLTPGRAPANAVPRTRFLEPEKQYGEPQYGR
jgi:ferric-dicitrate binding protein FerR (iron transport regulator)